ncbi:TetR/AcrR family transcriptional regulator [Nocardia flavorosea]|uniref:TetR/AcrR family transcriptional regulator n=1 Tax=Nocardia flavorosea TaxID=53429 RepID=A0A846YE01_9NOCA|nr:TetR/AcrR family transcriptional regulator [Nocardia flavorosea]NKY55029.1 TetR/AcrR family transcriptional regulator [Nocardia flavorosea]
MPRRKDPDGPRAAMIRSAISLIRRRGVAAVSFTDVLNASGAPRGSVYHHFPGGKTQLVTEATRVAGARVTGELTRVLETPETAAALRELAETLARGLDRGDYAVGCPIAAAALGNEPDAVAAAGATFDTWRDLIAGKLVRDGAAPQRARSVAVLVISALEGALIVARTERDPAALDTVVDELGVLCRSAVGTGASAPVSRRDES